MGDWQDSGAEADGQLGVEDLPTVPPSQRISGVGEAPPASRRSPLPVEPHVAADLPPPPGGASASSPPASIPPPQDSPPSGDWVTTDELDPRLLAVEGMLAKGDWQGVYELLGPRQHARDLPPTLGLIYAAARREVADEESDTEANLLAVSCMARLLGVPKDSAAALQLSKRVLRGRMTVNWREAKAPPARVSTLIMAVVLAIGALAGWMLGPGGVLH
jgi:hypothetical protein